MSSNSLCLIRNEKSKTYLKEMLTIMKEVVLLHSMKLLCTVHCQLSFHSFKYLFNILLHVNVQKSLCESWFYHPLSSLSFFSLVDTHCNSEQTAPPPLFHRDHRTQRGPWWPPSQRSLLFCLQGKELGCRGVFWFNHRAPQCTVCTRRRWQL